MNPTPKPSAVPLGEIAVCTTPNCPHALHRMSVEEYKAALAKKAVQSAEGEK